MEFIPLKIGEDDIDVMQFIPLKQEKVIYLQPLPIYAHYLPPCRFIPYFYPKPTPLGGPVPVNEIKTQRILLISNFLHTTYGKRDCLIIRPGGIAGSDKSCV